MPLALVSSEALCAGLRRLDLGAKHPSSSSHQVWIWDSDGKTCTVVLGKNPVSRGVLRTILRQAGLSEDELRIALGGTHARSVKRRRQSS